MQLTENQLLMINYQDGNTVLHLDNIDFVMLDKIPRDSYDVVILDGIFNKYALKLVKYAKRITKRYVCIITDYKGNICEITGPVKQHNDTFFVWTKNGKG